MMYFPAESGFRLDGGHQVGPHPLDGAKHVKFDVAGKVHIPHPPGTQATDHLEPLGDSLADQGVLVTDCWHFADHLARGAYRVTVRTADDPPLASRSNEAFLIRSRKSRRTPAMCHPRMLPARM